MPSVPGIRERDGRADEVVGAEARRVDLAHEVLVGEEERAKVHRVGVANHGHQEVARPVGPLDVDRESESDVFVAADPGRALLVDGVDEGRVERGDLRQSLDDGEGDEVREGDLGAARARQRLVQRRAIDLQQPRRDGAHAGRGRNREAGLHVGDDARGGPAQGRRRRRRSSGATTAAGAGADVATLGTVERW